MWHQSQYFFLLLTILSFSCLPFYIITLSDSPPHPRHPLLLTVAGANSKADALLLSVKDHVEAFHDDSPHHCTGARLGHSKLIAVLLGRGNILNRPQVLLHIHTGKMMKKREKSTSVFDTKYHK